MVIGRRIIGSWHGDEGCNLDHYWQKKYIGRKILIFIECMVIEVAKAYPHLCT